MRLGNVLGGAAEGFKDTWTKVDEWRKEAEDRKARRAIQEAMQNAPKPGETVLGSKNPAQDHLVYAGQQGVPPEIADQGIEAVRAWQESKAGAVSPETNLQPVTGRATEVAGSRAAALPVAPAAAPAPVPTLADGTTVALNPQVALDPTASAVPTKGAIGGADLSDSRAASRFVSFADPVGGRTMYTDRPRYATQADNLEYTANAMISTGVPEYIQQGNAMRVQAMAVREQERVVEHRETATTVQRALGLWRAGKEAEAQALFTEAFIESGSPVTPVFGTVDGKPTLSLVANDTGGTVIQPPTPVTLAQIEDFANSQILSYDQYAAWRQRQDAIAQQALENARAAAKDAREAVNDQYDNRYKAALATQAEAQAGAANRRGSGTGTRSPKGDASSAPAPTRAGPPRTRRAVSARVVAP